jgi:hypothetical protein
MGDGMRLIRALIARYRLRLARWSLVVSRKLAQIGAALWWA